MKLKVFVLAAAVVLIAHAVTPALAADLNSRDELLALAPPVRNAAIVVQPQADTTAQAGLLTALNDAGRGHWFRLSDAGSPAARAAQVLLEGGVIGHDVITTARKLRRETVSVSLRAVSPQTGEVLASVISRSTVSGAGGDDLQPRALQQAIEKAVHALVVEGADSGLWTFADPAQQQRLVERHREALLAPGDVPTDEPADEPAPPVREAGYSFHPC
jgi:hypothetical protein